MKLQAEVGQIRSSTHMGTQDVRSAIETSRIEYVPLSLPIRPFDLCNKDSRAYHACTMSTLVTSDEC